MPSQGKIIAAVFPKGGEWKSTLIQTVATSRIFSSYHVRILEADSQNSLSDWLDEREAMKKPPLPIELCNYDSNKPLKRALVRYQEEVDFLFVDLPGESKSLELTRAALAYADVCITPIRSSDKAIRAFENNLLPVVQMMSDLRSRQHYYLLPTFAHTSAKAHNHRDLFMPYSELYNLMQSIHRDRQIFTYFSQGGSTLLEYRDTLAVNSQEYMIATKAVDEIETIAKEIFQICQSF